MIGAFAMSASVYLIGLFFDQTGSYNLGWMINVSAVALSFIVIMITLGKKKVQIQILESKRPKLKYPYSRDN